MKIEPPPGSKPGGLSENFYLTEEERKLNDDVERIYIDEFKPDRDGKVYKG